VLAAFAASQDATDPLRGLSIGQQPEPEAPDGWEVIEVRAAALNQHDIWSLRGVGLAGEQLPMILGTDAAGVTADGRAVVAHAVIREPGRRWSLPSERHPGTLAERVAVPSGNLMDKPPELSFEEAACLPTAYLTAYRMLFVRGALRPGQRVLVQGATGGVATAAIILAVAAGLEVTATSRSERGLELAGSLGAHHAKSSGERLPAQVDAVIETVGEATWGHSLRAVRDGGRVVVAGATSGPNPPGDLQRVFIREIAVMGSSMGTREELEELIRFMRLTDARPLIDSVHPLSAAQQGFRRLLESQAAGKVVISTDGSGTPDRP
jgi:NADPH:quinone reductase-like Zn-dependent oxidoreductase